MGTEFHLTQMRKMAGPWANTWLSEKNIFPLAYRAIYLGLECRVYMKREGKDKKEGMKVELKKNCISHSKQKQNNHSKDLHRRVVRSNIPTTEAITFLQQTPGSQMKSYANFHT